MQRLLKHMRLVHPFDKKASLVCALGKCEKIYNSSESYRKHVQREHRDFLDVYESSECCLATQSPASDCVDYNHDISSAPITDEQNHIGHVMQLLARNVAEFALQTRESYLLPKSTCSSIISDVSVLFVTFFEQFSQFILCRLEDNGIDISTDHCLSQLLMDHSLLSSLWTDIGSDARLKRYCKENLGLIEAETVLLGINEVTGKPESYQYVPLHLTVKRYVEHEDVWESINRTLSSTSDVLQSYTDGTAFQQHHFFAMHPYALRIHLYIDDLELCNPLGSAKKKHAITAVYFQIGNVEQRHLSVLKSIHVACIAKSSHVKKYGLQKVLERLVNDVSSFESVGIAVTVDGNVHRLFASLATVSADNLASHEIGGFRMCFSSGHVCRFCMIRSEHLTSFYSETNEGYPKLRTVQRHNEHTAAVARDSSLSSAYGVVKQSPLHPLHSFHAASSLPPDCMHDVFEGVIPIVLKVCLRGLIAEKIFNLKVINDRLQQFRFGRNDVKNVPPVIPLSFPKSSIPGSAAQKWCLFRNLAFIIGDLVPSSSKFWTLYLLCRKMVEIIFAPSVTVSQVSYLDLLVSQHHTMLLQLAPEEFTPKCHYLTHYPRLISVYGPVRHLWCMRFESYHQYLKSVARSCGNFKNICRTLADRNQMRKCMEQSGRCCLQGDEFVHVVQTKSSIRSLPCSLQRPVACYFGCSVKEEVVTVKSAVLGGVHYSVKDCLVLDVLDGDVPVFFVISHILSYDGIWGLAGTLAFSSQFLTHYHAYSIKRDSDWLVLMPGTELNHRALDIYRIQMTALEEEVVALRHSLPY